MKLKSLCTAVLFAGLATLTVSCKTKGTPVPPPEPVPPAQYGSPEAAAAAGENAPAETAGGRFGYTGTEGAPPAPEAPAPAPAPPAPEPSIRDVRDIDTPKPTVEEKPAPPPAPPTSSSTDMPYANAVPGNPLVVTLPGAHASLGQISIEKYDSSKKPTGKPLERGTPVQIPDPNNPGKKIFFKVP